MSNGQTRMGCIAGIGLSLAMILGLGVLVPAAQAVECTAATNCEVNYTLCDGDLNYGDVSCPSKPGYRCSCTTEKTGFSNVGKDYGGKTCTSYSTALTYYYARLYFDANGGSGAPSGMSDYSTSSYGSATFTIPSVTPVRNGYTFLGWSTSVQASPLLYSAGDQFTVRYGGNTTLYAIWQKDEPKDTVKPVIKGTDDKSITVGDKFDPKQGVTATDNVDGDLTSKITVTGNMDTSKPGKYELTYTVSDKAGNTATVKRVITVNPVMHAAMPATGSADGVIIEGGVIALLFAFACSIISCRNLRRG